MLFPLERSQEALARSMSNNKLQVTLLADEWKSSKGGLSTINRELAIQLAKHPNVSVTFLVPKCTEDDKNASSDFKVRIVEAQEKDGFDPIDWLSFPPDDLSINIVIGHGVKLGKYAQIIRKSHQCKWVQVVHTAPEQLSMLKTYSDCDNAISKGDIKQWNEIKLCQKADLVVAVGPRLWEFYSRYLNPSGKHVFNLTPGIFSEFSSLELSTVKRKKFNVLLFGRSDSEDFELKGFDLAAKAVAQLNDSSYQLVFVGAPSGNEKQVAEKLLGYGLRKSQLIVKPFLENREDLATLLSTADLAIIPSRSEGFGLTALEALSAGLPFLVTQTSGFGEALEDILPQSTPWVVDFEESDEWAEAIKSVREKGREAAIAECQTLRKNYGEKYTWESQCSDLVEKMFSLANAASRSKMESSVTATPSQSLNEASIVIPEIEGKLSLAPSNSEQCQKLQENRPGHFVGVDEGGNVVDIIDGDDNYKEDGDEVRDLNSRWERGKASLQFGEEISQSKIRVHLFNLADSYELEPVEDLLNKIAQLDRHHMCVEKHSFRRAKMSEMVDKIPTLEMDMAFFVVHAHEHRLLINEDKVGIGYTKIYRALLQATGGNVIIVIGGDDNYDGVDEENREVISRWAKRKVSSQFSIEYLDGRKSFIFSWNKQHRVIHEQALLHHFDPNKEGKEFDYQPCQLMEQNKPRTPPPLRSKEDPNRYRAVNCEERVGFIPYNYVKKQDPVEPKPMPWFHGNISTTEAERLLNPREDGMFLIRNSSTYKGDYALSVCYGHNIEHYRIMKKDDGKLTIDEEIFFGSLFEFIERFSSLADGLCTTLAKPVYRGGKKIYAIDPRSFDKGGWEVDRSCLYPRDCIGRGDFGDIFQAEYHNQKVAVKIYSAERYQDVQAFLIEAAIMTDLQHRNIVTLLGVSSAQNPFYLVTEFCAKGNLLEFLSRTGSGSIKEDDLVRLAQDVAGGMRYLQSKDVVHRGLMARNILIHQDGTAKVSEFGLAQLPSLSSERKNTSDKWTAPEAIRRGIFSSQSDVWSYGVLLWVLFSVGENPYSNLPADHLVDEIERGYRMECPKGCNTVIYGMMSNCWHIDPKKRPNFKKIWEVLASFYYNQAPLEIRSRGRRALTAHKKALSEGRRFIKRVPIMLIGQDRSGKTSLAKSLKGERFNPEEDSTVGIHIDPSHFNLSTEIWKQGEKEDIYSVLWDFGGQAVYYTIHPLFLTSRAIYLLVNDLSRHLHHKAKSVMKQGMFTKSQDSFRFKTNADYLDFWMSSVASFAIQDESNSRETKSDWLPELPPVFLVCTHADKPFDGRDPRKLGNEVFGHLQTKPYQNHIHDVFIVDNTKSGHELGCPEVLRLRQEIRAVAEELPHMKEAVPIKWLKFEEVMQAKKDEGNSWIFLEEAKETAWEVCNVSDVEEFRTLLDFFHDQRTLIHFDDTPELDKMVVLDVQWLVDVFKEVITIRPYDNKEKKFKKLWSRLEEEGVLEEPLLEHVWGPLYRKEDTCQSLIAIMEKFSLLCSWPSSDGSCGKQYLVPSMLMSHPPEEIMKLIASAKIPSLFIKFETGQVPPGLFPRLVLQVLQWCKEECTKPERPQLYHNFVRIYSSEEVNCSIILLCHMSSIEVVVHKDDDGLEMAHGSKSAIGSPVSSNHDTFASVVLRKLELILEYMRKEFCWLQNMKYEVSFLCPVCCQGGTFRVCKRHSTEHCKREECLHFWPESELFSAKEARCTKYAAAETSKVPVKKLEPWFSRIRNQLTVDKCDGGNLASVEDDEETFSAGEVLQIRLTQQRENQTISPQLKGSLQLEGACPDTPDFESKSGEMLPNLGKTNATTEIYLPDIVEQSLLSASCDAKEIVHLLKENLQLNKDFLERPDHDTKKIIRSLAQKAKDLKRLDVFEHLREIAPAGTAGPLLPETLPVQDMPINKAWDLTIHLSGGDEWMELAEGLGLTPLEIRFLDKRTINPMEAALSFIAKQRFLSVGELYELLNERDLPMLADLL